MMSLFKEDIGDRIYDMVLGLFVRHRELTESEYDIDDSELEPGEMWYDAIREEYIEEAYNKLSVLMKDGEFAV